MTCCPPEHVTDVRSNSSDQIYFVAKLIGRSDHCRKVFQAIYRGKKKIKSISDISKTTGLSNIQVLKVGGKLSGNQIVQKLPKAYQKDKFYAQHYRKILSLSVDSKKLSRYPTKVQPKITLKTNNIRVSFSKAAGRAKHITIDEIDSFSLIKKARNKNPSLSLNLDRYPEENIKVGFKKIIGEKGTFTDWGGEKNDLYTTRIKIKGKRRIAAFAFKGGGTRGPLTLDKMGKKADQIHRLFDSQAAEVFLVVYKGQIQQIILEQMQAYAIGRALKRGDVYFGVIDGDDLKRLMIAYRKCFE